MPMSTFIQRSRSHPSTKDLAGMAGGSGGSSDGTAVSTHGSSSQGAALLHDLDSLSDGVLAEGRTALIVAITDSTDCVGLSTGRSIRLGDMQSCTIS